MRKLILGILMLCWSAVHSAEIIVDATSAKFKETTDAGVMECVFKRCMANDLYTFYQVRLDGKLVNSAQYSDNIGPFLVIGKGWIGGNHLSGSNKKTAKTVDVSICADGLEIAEGQYEASALEVNVTNELYVPDGSIFAIETVKYLVAGNSIEVWVQHDYQIESEATVERYYGMQSMFENETEILAPGAKKYNKWIPVVPNGSANAINIKNYEAPKFSVFVEKSANGYQASYMERQDLGKRGKLGVEDVVFIGNSYGKCYHKTIGNAKVQPGETTKWHGVYSWFKSPLADTFSIEAEAPVFEYPAYVDGEESVLSVDGQGNVVVTPAAGLAGITEDECQRVYYDLRGVRMPAPVAGQVCISKGCKMRY